MARIELAPEVGEDFERMLGDPALHLAAHIAPRLREIVVTIDVPAPIHELGDQPATASMSW